MYMTVLYVQGFEAGANALLAAGADINARRGRDDATPLFIARRVDIPQVPPRGHPAGRCNRVR